MKGAWVPFPAVVSRTALDFLELNCLPTWRNIPLRLELDVNRSFGDRRSRLLLASGLIRIVPEGEIEALVTLNLNFGPLWVPGIIERNDDNRMVGC